MPGQNIGKASPGILEIAILPTKIREHREHVKPLRDETCFFSKSTSPASFDTQFQLDRDRPGPNHLSASAHDISWFAFSLQC
jgi:hypothetical protein